MVNHHLKDIDLSLKLIFVHTESPSLMYDFNPHSANGLVAFITFFQHYI